MSFLEINNVLIPVAQGGEIEPLEVGSTQRTVNGGIIRDRRALKRRWKFRTIPMEPVQAAAIMGLVQGRGHCWTFDGSTTDPITTATNALTASGSGLIPSTLTGSTLHRRRRATNDWLISNVYTAPNTRGDAAARNGQAIGVHVASNNELAANERDCENAPATDFTAVAGATLSTETTKFFMGSKALKIVAGGANQGARTASIGVVAGEVWTFSVYLLGESGGEDVYLTIDDDGGGAATSASFLLAANEWKRCWVTHTVTAGGTAIIPYIRAGSGTPTWYCDNLQCEEKAYPTAWYDGDRASADEASYDGTWLNGAPGVTAACWCNGSASAKAGSSIGTILAYGADANTSNSLYLSTTGNGYLYWATTTGGATVDSGNQAVQNLYGVWFHVASVWDVDAATIKIYKNGSLLDTLTGVTMETSDIAEISIGSAYGANQLSGEIDDALVVPYVMDATSIDYLYNSGTPPVVGSPRLIASGDFAPDSSVTVIGSVQTAAYIGAMQSGTWYANNRALNILLEEV